MISDPEHEVIRVNQLSAVFPNGNGGLRALDELTFTVCAQEFICVLGPSGSGKSTLLRILAGLLAPTHGEVLYKGVPITDPNRDVGVVFQKPNLMPWRTVQQNIALPLELDGGLDSSAVQKVREMVELVGLEGFEHVLPRDLSGGMAQRVAIARALIHDPQVLLLDEPFGSLDALTRERMGSELLRIWQAHKQTVVMVTHSISEALYLADRVLVLSQRPGQLRLDLKVCFSRPRQDAIRYTADFGILADQVRAAIGDL